MHIEHEVHERTLELGTSIDVHGESGACELGCALEVNDAQFYAKIPVRLGLEAELRAVAPATDLDIAGFVLARRHSTVRQVRNPAQTVRYRSVQSLDGILSPPDFRVDRAGLFHYVQRVQARPARPRDLRAQFVALLLERLNLSHRSAPRRVCLGKLVEHGGVSPVGQPDLHLLKVLAQIGTVKHGAGGSPRELRPRGRPAKGRSCRPGTRLAGPDHRI